MGVVMIVNAKNRPFSWSYSALTDFEGCPARYAAKRFYCTTVEPPTEHTLWGTRVHEAFEARLKNGTPFGEGMESFEPWAKALAGLPGQKFFEQKFAVTETLQNVDFFHRLAWGRGVVDLLIVAERGTEATLIDYKTGKRKDDDTQLKVFSWFCGNYFPMLERFKYRYLWLKPGTVSGGELLRADLDGVWEGIARRVEDVQTAWTHENFPLRPSGLCGWCPVEECIHWYDRTKSRGR